MVARAAAAIAVSLAAAVAVAQDPGSTGRLSSARQLVVVTTADWSATSGTLRRFERRRDSDAWTAVGAAVPIVVGRTGLALGVGFESADPTGPAKREGDGKAPAGVFPLDTAFGFAPRSESRGVRLPYVQLTANTDCVDDSASAHYNTVVDKQRVRRIDWTSAEHMRAVAQYERGVIVGYNARHPARGRGSCIFLHIWSGPGSSTVGCTALDASELRTVVEWLDPRRKPVLVQLPSSVYERLRPRWALPG